MKITETKVFLRSDGDKKLKAYATITFDDSFVVRDLKVIEGSKGMFIAMPSRKMKDPCPKCRHRNVVGAKHCNQCGGILPAKNFSNPKDEKFQEHRDIAHPITANAREYIQAEVLKAYESELARSNHASVSRAHEPEPKRPSPTRVGQSTYIMQPSDPLEAKLEATDL
ncbi:septation protein SpoVG family protein [PVC group bacterium]|nr:septation protein SpoVG family protein [PVC group bacterium]